MASRAQSVVLTYVAWDTTANAGKTGDVANHTLRWVKDGTSSAPTNAPAEVDATNAPGVYKLTLTTAECTCDCGTLTGKSSTANVAIIPVTISFEQLPTAAPNANGGLPILSSAGTTLAYTVSTVTTYTGNTPQTGDAYARLGLPATTSISTDLAAVKADTGGISTTVAEIKFKTDNLPADPASNTVVNTRLASTDYTAPSSAATIATTVWANGTRTLTDKAGFALSSAGLDSVVVETGVNARQALAVGLAASAGVVSGQESGTVTIKGGNVATTRIVAVCDNAGNRSAVTLTLPS